MYFLVLWFNFIATFDKLLKRKEMKKQLINTALFLAFAVALFKGLLFLTLIF